MPDSSSWGLMPVASAGRPGGRAVVFRLLGLLCCRAASVFLRLLLRAVCFKESPGLWSTWPFRLLETPRQKGRRPRRGGHAARNVPTCASPPPSRLRTSPEVTPRAPASAATKRSAGGNLARPARVIADLHANVEIRNVENKSQKNLRLFNINIGIKSPRLSLRARHARLAAEPVARPAMYLFARRLRVRKGG